MSAVSHRMKENEFFLRLLLNTTSQQQKVLLDTVTDNQLDLLSEVIHNILYVVPIAQQERKSLLRKQVLVELAKIKRSYKYRRTRVKVNKKEVMNILVKYARELLSTLDEV